MGLGLGSTRIVGGDLTKVGTYAANRVLGAVDTGAGVQALNATIDASGSLLLTEDDQHIEFACSVGSVKSWLSVEPGTAPPTDHRVLIIGHNRNVGGRIDATKAAAAFAVEYRYVQGGREYFEFNDEVDLADGTRIRPFQRSTNDLGVSSSRFSGAVTYAADGDDTADVLGYWTADGRLGLNVAPGASRLNILQPAEASESWTAFKVTAGANTGGATAQDLPLVVFDLSSIVTSAAGAKAEWNAVKILAPTLAFVDAPGSSTVDDASTLYVTPPSVGAHATLTRIWAIHSTGKGRFDDVLSVVTTSGMRVLNDIAASQGIDLRRRSDKVWGANPIGTTKTICFGQYATVDGVDSLYAPYPGFTTDTPGITTVADATGGLFVTNSSPATVGSQVQHSPRISRTANAWNTGGTPKTERWMVADQVVVAAGNPSTATWKITARRASQAEVPLFAIPTTTVTITGATTDQLITALKNAFPFFV